jgi:hypothetical protein
MKRLRTADKDTVTWLTDVTPLAWVEESLKLSAHHVASIVPEGFAAYARVLHPHVEEGKLVRWAELARRNGRVAHPHMQFPFIASPQTEDPPPELGGHIGPSEGVLPIAERRVLVELLRPATSTPEQCWFAVWEGWGHDDRGVTARLVLPHRRYLVYGGPVEAALARMPRSWVLGMNLLANQPLETDEPLDPEEIVASASALGDDCPNLWWPEDRAWFVATPIDLSSTYIGGSRELVGRLLGNPQLEAVPAGPDDSLILASDEINNR